MLLPDRAMARRFRSHLPIELLFVALIAVTPPCFVFAQSAPATPAAMLKWSMGKYAEMPTFQADCKWSMTMGSLPGGTTAKRTLQVARPNLFKIVSVNGMGGITQTSVSDGKSLVEFATGTGLPAQSYSAPGSIADASSMQMGHPMFCGTLLYKFFGGPNKYAALVNETKMPVSFGPTVTVDGQECRTIKFWAQGMYGKTAIVIGTKDGLVHVIRYGSEPLMEMERKMMQSGELQATLKKATETPEFKAQAKKSALALDPKVISNALKMMPSSTDTAETYVNIVVGKPIDPAVFTAKAPEGDEVQQVGGGSTPTPPVPLGKPAPDIAVTSLTGTKKTLADYKGRVVLIDFWATWCPPCRKGLPETQKFYTEYGQKGLAVLTISDEDKPTVAAFIKENKYTFPAYLDPGSATNKAYNISAIPTIAIIDKNGNLAAYMVGLTPPEDILAALKKAGMQAK